MRRFLRLLKILGIALFWIASLALLVRAWVLRPRVGLEPVAPQGGFELLTDVALEPGDPTVFAVTEKKGLVKWFTGDSLADEGVVLDLTDRVYWETTEEGLLSVAFDPDFDRNGFLYVFYSLEEPLRSRLSRFHVPNRETMKADPDSEVILLEIPKPNVSHNGGDVRFGADGYLYASIGEGKPDDRSFLQSGETLYGSIIRLDVSDVDPERSPPYDIPASNPFTAPDDPRRDELWAYGLRNVWRFGFDRKTGEIYAGDVGSNRREEVNLIKKGGNYGWPHIEGGRCTHMAPKDCDPADYEAPVATLARWVSRSITGGFVYRGKDLPSLQGTYVFGDYLRGLYSFDLERVREDPALEQMPTFLVHKLPTPYGAQRGRTMLFTSFAETESGELFVTNIEGTIHRLRPLGTWEAIRGYLYMYLSFR